MIFLDPNGNQIEVDKNEENQARKMGLKKAYTFIDQNSQQVVVPEDKLEDAARLNLRPLYSQDKEQISSAETLGRGLASSVSLGFADELAGGAQALYKKGFGTKSEKEQSLKDLYQRERDEYRARNEQAYNKNPGLYGAGYAGGLLVSPGAALIKSGKHVGKILSSQGAAAGVGGGGGLGQADLTKGELKELGVQAGAGAALGGIGAKVLPHFEKSIIQRYIENKIKDAMVGNIKKNFKLPSEVSEDLLSTTLEGGEKIKNKISKLQLSPEQKKQLKKRLESFKPTLNTGGKIGDLAATTGLATIGLRSNSGIALQGLLTALFGVPMVASSAIRTGARKGFETLPRTTAEPVADIVTKNKLKEFENQEEAEPTKTTTSPNEIGDLTPEELEMIRLAREEAELNQRNR